MTHEMTPAAYTEDTLVQQTSADYRVKNGVMEPRAMFDTPFTHINDQGVIGVFGEAKSKKTIVLIRHINANAGTA